MSRMFLVAILSVLSDLMRVMSLPPRDSLQCGPNEMATDCYNDCQLTCRNRIKGYFYQCTDKCTRAGCICLPEYYRHDDGSCVLVENCSPPYCNDDEIYDSCGTSCLDSCEERGNTCQDCSLQCVEGCFCPEGNFRAPNGTCVKAAQCEPRICNGPNEYFDECPPTCLGALDQSCFSLLSGTNWTETLECCEPQCRCKPGFFRGLAGFCIPADQCLGDGEDFVITEWLLTNRLETQRRNETKV